MLIHSKVAANLTMSGFGYQGMLMRIVVKSDTSTTPKINSQLILTLEIVVVGSGCLLGFLVHMLFQP